MIEELKKLEDFVEFQHEKGRINEAEVEIYDALLNVAKELAQKCEILETKVDNLETFIDDLSEDLYDVQEVLAKELGYADDLNGEDLSEFFARMNADDADEDEHHHCNCGHDHGCDCGDGCDCGCGDDECGCDNDDNGYDGGKKVVRCPFCNTILFVTSQKGPYSCPFCENKFTDDDVE